jgi:hypothetical protein
MNRRDTDPLLDHLFYLAALRSAEAHSAAQAVVQDDGRHVLKNSRVFGPALGDNHFDTLGLAQTLGQERAIAHVGVCIAGMIEVLTEKQYLGFLIGSEQYGGRQKPDGERKRQLAVHGLYLRREWSSGFIL